MDSIKKKLTEQSTNTYSKSTQAEEDVSEMIQSSEMVVFTDADADGLASAGLIEYVFGDTLDICVIPAGPHRSVVWESTALDLITEHIRKDATVWILDTCFNEQDDWIVEKFKPLSEKARINLFDHHEWSDENRVEYIKQFCDYFEVDSLRDDAPEWEINGQIVSERCTAQMVYDYMVENQVEFPLFLKDRIKAVASGDLWLRNDETDTFMHPDTALVMDSVEYITKQSYHERRTKEWYGYKLWIDHLFKEAPLQQTELQNYADEFLSNITEQVDYLLNNREEFISTQKIGSINVIVIYGDIAPNYLAEELRQEGYDLVASIRPNGRVSFRGTDNFTKCNQIADSLGGGGHEKASGASLFSLFPENENEYSIDDYREEYGKQIREKLLKEISNFV